MRKDIFQFCFFFHFCVPYYALHTILCVKVCGGVFRGHYTLIKPHAIGAFHERTYSRPMLYANYINITTQTR